MKYYQAAARIAPENRDVLRGLVFTSDRMGAPQVALKTIEEHPGVVTDAERRQVEGDQLAAEVRLGMVNQDPKAPYAGTDKAIADLDAKIAEWEAQGPETQENVTRARFDRVIALKNRNRMREAANEYEALTSQGATPPVFVLGAAGDAYMDLHEPEKARDIYLQLLQYEPKNHLVRRQLFYAYVDLGDYKNAYRMADEMLSDGSIWDRSKNVDVPMTPDQHREAELTAGAARLYFGEVSEADVRVLPAVAENPDAPSSHEAMGNLDNAHDHPRAALQEYEAGVQVAGGENLSNEVGAANTQLALHNFPEAQADIQNLMERYPDNASVERANRDWQVHNMAEFDLTAGYAFRPDTSQNVTGGEMFGVEGKIYSPPIDDYWRIFAGEAFAQQKEPDNEGSVGFSRSTLGVEYRNGPLTANLAPTYNAFHSWERIGVAGDASYNINDNWAVAGGGELMSRDTPLRAMNHGITADEVAAHAVWQPDETQSVRFGGAIMPFSDSNLRTSEGVDYTRQMWIRPYWKIEGLASLGLDQNSEDENRSYFNPKSDLMALIGPRVTEVLYQRYSTLWQHSLSLLPGLYWQDHYGTDAAFRARYEHRMFFAETFEAGLGFNYARQSYDGNPENDFSLTLDVVDHF
jgi:biofilm PGA synthesis protein PgaA